MEVLSEKAEGLEGVGGPHQMYLFGGESRSSRIVEAWIYESS